jgi:hypothetical protein
MGYGEIVGNASVHWTVIHEDELGRETASVRGRDPVRFDSIGAKRRMKRVAAKGGSPSKSLFSKPNFQVRLKYGSKEEAQRAKESAQIVEREGAVFLVLNVPAIKRSKEKVDPPSPPAEVRVDW